ncbi:MAG: aminotransferase class III-fold pyridoxal phosphate-dependent enzyme [Nostocales cyanobacterium]|nr:MAG: aminotransferase class III-fold pyridoxal phosphate-dependent enzyme [Nostocales cyanobacterium]TAF19450.1 MAG: aminotransferase class III-fold pyridoxal phosphate-dependent enzyme [Nostocales cyanobacterium]
MSQNQTSPQIERSLHLLTLSAKSEQALFDLAIRYQKFLQAETASLADICFSANTRRSHFEHRLSVICNSQDQLQENLFNFTAGYQLPTVINGQSPKNPPPLTFLFTGQSSQYINMGRQLYEQAPIFRQIIDQANEILLPYLETPLIEILYPQTEDDSLINQTIYTQPALFALEYALTQLWQSWGIKPAIVIGHSLGEYVAACVAGAFSFEEGLKLVAKRAILMQSLPENGQMAAVFADLKTVETAIQPYLEKISIAAINSPQNTVISGVGETIETVIATLENQGIETRRLKVSHAFHSPLMESMLSEFAEYIKEVKFQPLQIPLISNLTGQIIAPGQILDSNYWLRQIREPVKFMTGINTLFELGYEVFLEIGAKPVLSSLGKHCQQENPATWLSSLEYDQENWQSLFISLANLYIQGVKINWKGFDQPYTRNVLPLPTYPFQRQRYWFDTINNHENQPRNNILNNHPNQQEQNISMTTITNDNKQAIVLQKVRALVAKFLKAKPEEIDIHLSFLEMGADSIAMLDAIRAIENTYNFKITIRQLFEELPNIQSLANHIADNLSSEWINANLQEFTSTPAAKVETIKVETTTQSNIPLTSSENGIEQIMRQQLELVSQSLSAVVSQQLEFLQKNGLATSNNHHQNGNLVNNKPTEKPVIAVNNNQPKTNGNKPSVNSGNNGIYNINLQLTPEQESHLKTLITRYNQKTQTSKQRAQTYRPVLSDSRAAAGFRISTKEMVYPIIGQKAAGSKFWDIDGNEYLDITMGFGVLLFGHAPSFITQALQSQIETGLQIGPQSPLAGEVAELICELTGMERVTFCNSGTEAVMTGLRLARTATGRNKIAIFKGAYHGHFDGILARASNGNHTALPLTLGVSEHSIEDVIVLDYGTPESLEILHSCANELAAVLVEPVQSRHPDLQPQEFLTALRQVTANNGSALILDEVITGFRIHPRGAQAWFDIDADMTIYGKIIGGGMPIGVVAGKAAYMNGIDGGLWEYGDNSYPQAEKTFFAGTFNKNHTGMAAARAVLQHLKEQGSKLQLQLNQRTTYLANTLNDYFQAENVPIKIIHFGSLFRFTFTGNLDLLFYHLLLNGVYIWEGRNCFISTAHTDQDIEFLIQAVKNSVEELRTGGFLPKQQTNQTITKSEGILIP